MRVLCILLLAVLVNTSFCWADAAYKQKHVQHFVFENYMTSDDGPIGMIGIHFDTYYSETNYYTLSVFEAVGGHNRAGYAVASIGLGQNFKVSDQTAWDSMISVGGGGGGHLTKITGGGLTWKIQTGLHHQLTPAWGFVGNVGWLTFPDGGLSSFLYSVGFSWTNFDIREPVSL